MINLWDCIIVSCIMHR